MITVDETSPAPAERPGHRRRRPRWPAGTLAVVPAAVSFIAHVWQPSAVDGYRSSYLSRVQSLYADNA